LNYEVGKYAFYIEEENKILATGLFGVLEAMNVMFDAKINIARSKVSSTSRNFIDVDGVAKEAGFGYKGLYQFFKNELKVPINTDKSFARTSSSWHIFLDNEYKIAYDKFVAEDKSEQESAKTETVVETENQDIEQTEGEVKNEGNEGRQEEEDLSSNVGMRIEAGSSEDQEGTPNESGAPVLDGTGAESELKEEAVQPEPKKRGRKKKAE